MFTSAFGIRFTSAVYANDRLSPPFAVYATSTPCSSLFRLEVGCELSSFIDNSVDLFCHYFCFLQDKNSAKTFGDTP